MILFIILATVDNLLLPPFEADNEQRHYAYVRHLVQGHGLPTQESVPTDSESDGLFQAPSQPPLYYILAAAATAWIPGADKVEAALHRNPYFAFQAPNFRPDNENFWLRSPHIGTLDPGFLLALHLARAVSTCLGVAAVVGTYGLGLVCFAGDRTMACLSAAWVAFNPQFVYSSGVVSNDSAAAGLATVVLWSTARWVVHGPSVRRAIMWGITLGLAALTKVSVLGLIPICALGFWLGVRGKHASHAARYVILTVGLGILLAGWWYVRGAFLYGDPFGVSPHLSSSPWLRQQPPSILRHLLWLGYIDWTYWAAFGWGIVQPASWLLGIVVWWERIGLLGVGVYVWRSWRALGQRKWLIGLLFMWLAVCRAALLWWLRAFPLALGRLMFPTAAALGVLLVIGWSGWLPSRWQRIGLGAMTGGLLAFALAAPLALIRPAFVRPPQLSPAQVEALEDGRRVVIGGAARLLGAEVNPDPVYPGGWTWVKLCWESLAPLEKDYEVFVHFVGLADRLVAVRHTYTGLGTFPTSAWQPGDTFCDRIWLPVDDSASAPAIYDVEIGLYDREQGKRLEARDEEGRPVELVYVGRIKLWAMESPAVTPPHPTDYHLGNQITLAGYDTEPASVRAGEPFTLTLYWRAERRPEADYTAFVHLSDGAGNLVVQVDGPPDRVYPTSWWEPGDVVADVRRVMVPTEAEKGTYQLDVGLYRWETGERLPVMAGDEVPVPNAVIQLVQIRVVHQGSVPFSVDNE